MQRHPAKHELLAYAESLVSGRSISAQLGAHISRCPVCAPEVQSMRQTLRLASSAAGLEPSREFTAQLLLAAKNERGAASKRRRRHRSVLVVARRFGYAAALIVVSTVWFGAASETPSSSRPAVTPAPAAQPVVASAASSVSVEELRQRAERLRVLTAAVKASSGSKDARAIQQTRLAEALDAELTEAIAALERNPGWSQASEVVQANLRRQEETLKQLWVAQGSLGPSNL